MAKTVDQIASRQVIAFNPNDDVTINLLPNPPDNTRLLILKTVLSTANYTINGNGKQIGDPRFLNPPQSSMVGAGLGRGLEFVFSTTLDRWQILSDFSTYLSESGRVSGAPPAFTPGGSFTPITGWPNARETRFFLGRVDPILGTIGIPVTGEYNVTGTVIGTQGNTNKELSILLWLRVNSTDQVVDVFDVATDKTDVRSFSFGLPLSLTANDTLQLGISWLGQSIGSFTINNAVFQVELDLEAPAQ